MKKQTKKQEKKKKHITAQQENKQKHKPKTNNTHKKPYTVQNPHTVDHTAFYGSHTNTTTKSSIFTSVSYVELFVRLPKMINLGIQ